jgi:hypothetical protein
VLCPSERYYQQRGRQPVKLIDRARQVLRMVCRWLPQRSIVVVADSSFAALELLNAVRDRLTVITRLRIDAALYAPVPARAPARRGRPRRKGERLPSLQSILEASTTRWQHLTIAPWYGQAQHRLDVVSGTAVWYHSGCAALPIRWVLVRDPQGKKDAQAFLGTDPDLTPQQILTWFTWRWQTEVTFENLIGVFPSKTFCVETETG